MDGPGRLIGSGNTSDVYALDDGFVIRLARSEGRLAAFQLEASAMDAVAAAGYPVPAVHEVFDLDGRAAMVLERIEGPDALSRLQKAPWELPRLARLTGQLQARLHRIPAPPDMPRLTELIPQLVRSPLVPVDVAASTERRLRRLPDGDTLLHGDFHPGNVLLGPDGPAVIDWENATSGPPAADVAMTWVLLRVAGTDADPSGPQRAVMVGARRLYARLHMRGLRHGGPASIWSEATAWVPVMAALRLREGADAEREALMALIGRWSGL